ncbi:MAG TPA: glycosyltransferase family 2 protein [Plantibacter sp.]|uniref:glycosyltransferase family 2 protein n=1 Tax=Plantibacter sp. TaxID=1871045 RepID=UPI002B6CEE52|nr:glycosyltransferase family 2 protein [Plantibacter sp.]
MGLPEDRPYVIYLCSSRTLIASEVEIVERIAQSIALHADGEPPTLVVRPHPVNPDPWAGFSHPGVVVYPERGDHADTTESWQDYYNQLSHASSFFGLNTTAFLEAVVVDRPCLTIVSDEFHAQQGFTGHFRHLIAADFLEVCADDDEVGERVARILRGVDEKADGRKAFVQSFIRPCGIDRAATLEVVEAIEQAVDPSAVVAEASAPRLTAPSGPAPERKSTRIDGSRGPVRHAPSAIAIAGAASSMPMSRPFFSIAIPTKNRPERVRDAVRSLVEQTFGDLEIIVCDNSDEAESAQTAAVVGEFDDPRIRYIRTSGRLSMPDNWEAAIADARGEFVGVLTDRSVFKRDTLEVVNADIENTGPKVVSWFNDLYGRDPSGTRFKRRPATFSRHELSSSEVFDYFVHGFPKYTPKIIPKLMTSVCHRSVLDAIRASGAGRVCPPVAPDFTSGFLMLAHCDWVLMIDESLYVSVGTGNGADFRRKGELAERFVQDLGMTWDQLVDLMPSDACFAHALILNDLMRVRELVPGRLGDVELDRAQYYLGCLNDYMKTARHGVTRDEDLDALLTRLDQDAPDVQRAVKSKRIYGQVVKMPSNGAQLKAEASAAAEAAGPPPLAFPTVWEAMAWDEANPRTPITTGFLDELPTIDDMKKARMIQPKGMAAKGRALWPVRTEDSADSARRKARKSSARAEESADMARRKARSRARRHELKLRKLEKKKPLKRRTRLFVRDMRNQVRLRTRLSALFGSGTAPRENEVAEARIAAHKAEAAERAARKAAEIETRRQAFAQREAVRSTPAQAAQRQAEAAVAVAVDVEIEAEAKADTETPVSR